MSPPTLRRARPTDSAALYDICRLTGDAGRDASAPGRDPHLLGHLYAAPYLAFAPMFAWVAEDEAGVCAYGLAAPDTGRFYQWMAQQWLPTIRECYVGEAHPADAALLRQLHADPILDVRLQAWPAHLHVDILPKAQGYGLGSRLMSALLGDLAGAAVPAVHLGVDRRNERALAWYGRFGFAELFREPGCVWFGRSLIDYPPVESPGRLSPEYPQAC
jgi:GNAT superfamily N-acetyltransferase